MEYAYYIADVFTNQVFNGAQIAVFPRAQGLDDRLMQSIATELNLSETVFVFPAQSAQTTRRMRIFSPKGEIDFGGHPTMAAAYVLASCGEITLEDGNTAIVLEQNAGAINVNISGESQKPVFIQFTMRVTPTIDRFAPTEHELAEILNLEEKDIERKRFNARLVSCGYPYLVVPVRSHDAVRKARFNYAAWSHSSAPQTAAQEILMFSRNPGVSDADFHVRLVGPNIAMNVDPPVGNAMPAFSAYLCSHEHIRKGTYTFAVDRGDVTGRRSVLNLEMDNKGLERLTLRVGGEAVMVAEGAMLVPG
ncbi:MAG: PhzF family phenazine biosynthesis protein [Pseudomonadota bacterium]